MTEKWGEIQGKWDFVRVIGVLPCIITRGRKIIKCNSQVYNEPTELNDHRPVGSFLAQLVEHRQSNI